MWPCYYLLHKRKRSELGYVDTVVEAVTELLSKAQKLRGYNLMNEENIENVKAQPNTYATIEAYTAATGKRFRMTKAQKERGLTREEAFVEFNTFIENKNSN